MKTLKSAAIAILVFSLILTLGLSFAEGSSGTFQYDDFTCRVLEDNTVELVKYNGRSSSVRIPSTINGHSVSRIGDNAFKDCTRLDYIDMSKEVTSIGVSAFEGCTKLDNIYYMGSSSITIIGECAFKGCTSLEYIDIPKGLTSIQASTFEGCTDMQAAYYMGSSSITSIGKRAFMNCSSLEYIDIPKKTTIISESAFEGCTDLEAIYYLSSSAVKTIDKYAFRGCTKLEELNAPKNLTEIGESAFEGCTNLERIYYLKENKVSIGVNAFANCPKLSNMPKTATVDESRLSARSTETEASPEVTSAPKSEDTTDLDPSFYEKWTCPNCGAETLGNYCDNCGSPKQAESIVPETTELVDLQDGWICPNCGNSTSGNFCDNCGSAKPTGSTIPVTKEGEAEAEDISSQTTQGVAVSSVENESPIPPQFQGGTVKNTGRISSDISWELYDNGLLIIKGQGKLKDKSALRSCRSDVKYVVLESGITEIGDQIFRSFELLEGISIPNTVTKIGSRAFYYCYQLKEITIPGSVQSMGEFMFYESGLEKITFMEGVKKIEDKQFRGAKNLKTVILPNTITEIDDRAFYYCIELEEIYIPGSVTEFGEFIFYGSGLARCELGEGITIINDQAFRGANNLEAVILPNSLIEIGSRAFYTCDMKEITIPRSVVKLGEYVFYGNNQLRTINYCGTNAEWNSIDMGRNDLFKKTTIIYDYVPDNTLHYGTRYEGSNNQFESYNETSNATPTPSPSTDQGANKWSCPNCGSDTEGNFCDNCGNPRPEENTVEDSTETATPNPTDTPDTNKDEEPKATTTSTVGGEITVLYTGEYTVGKDLNPGRYVVSVQSAGYSDILNKSYIEYQIAEYSESEGKWKRQQVEDLHEVGETASFSLLDGQRLSVLNGEFIVLQRVDIDKQDYGSGKTLYTGEYLVGVDIPAGRYVVSVQKAIYSEILNRSYIEYQIADYNESEGKWKRQQVEDLHEVGETASFSLLDGQKLSVLNGEFLIEQQNGSGVKNYGENDVLFSGEYLVGTDISAGRYVVSVQKAIYSDILNKSYIEYQIAEYNESEGKWKRQQVEDLHETGETASFSLLDGQKLSVLNGEFIILHCTDIDKQNYSPGATLYSGEYLVGVDIPAGTYVVSVKKAIYSDILKRSFIEYQIAEYNESKDKWERQQVKDLHTVDETASFTLEDGQKLSVMNGEFTISEYNK